MGSNVHVASAKAKKIKQKQGTTTTTKVSQSLVTLRGQKSLLRKWFSNIFSKQKQILFSKSDKNLQ
jgi:hypothetical protein